MAEDNLRLHIVTVFREIQFETLHLKNDIFPHFTMKIEAAGSPETSVHKVVYKVVIHNLRLLIDPFRPSRGEA
jgi:hypothetical protein